MPSPAEAMLPDNLRQGIEALSGLDLAEVKVHYNSALPGRNSVGSLHAHSYAAGTTIHLAPGEERHLAHEAWHIVQQKQGRVKPTMMLGNPADAVYVNDDPSLEREANVMGARALNL